MNHGSDAARSPRDRIKGALTVLAETQGLDVADAFQLLQRWSDDTRMSIPDVADVVVNVRARLGSPDRDPEPTD